MVLITLLNAVIQQGRNLIRDSYIEANQDVLTEAKSSLLLSALLEDASSSSCPVVFLEKQVSSSRPFLAPLTSFVRLSDEQ